MFYVVLADDPVPWGRVEGGGAVYSRHRKRYQDLILSRARSDQNLPFLHDHAEAVGKRTSVVVEQMNSARERIGVGLVYEGRISKVLPVEYDANSCDAGEDRVVFEPYRVRLLWGS